MSNPDIRLVKNKDIDLKKWDECIRNAAFGIAYAYSWYLDRLCPGWHALVWGDYLYVMPLPNARKFGFSFVYQPFFTEQLGVFSNFSPEPEIVNHFLHAIPAEYKFTDLNFNVGARPTSRRYSIKEHVTHHIDLSTNCQKIREGYSSLTLQNIRKAVKSKISVLPIFDINQFIAFTQTNLKGKSPTAKPQHYDALQKLIGFAIYHLVGEIYGAFDESNTLVSAAFFVTTNRKSICMAASSNEKGAELKAMSLLVDTFVANHAGNDLTLNFAGSETPESARFSRDFGAIPQTYYSVHQNRLPALLRFLKK